MKVRRFFVIAALALMASLTMTMVPSLADSLSANFESFALGSVNGQGGWSSTGNYDQSVVVNGYGYPSFGGQSFRISDGMTSGSFGDQTFTNSLNNEAGETDALNNGMSGGVRQSHFEAQFDIASTLSVLQPGMHVSVSPDRGDGARMSYLRFEDQADGIHVFFDDVTDPGHVIDGDVFSDIPIATIDRAPHTIKFVMDFVDGPDNDVVSIYIDGVKKITGTSWEDYYRFDHESNPTLAVHSRTVDSLLFREAGAADSGNMGKGFLFDNFTLTSSSDTTAPAVPTHISPANGTITTTANQNLIDWSDVSDPSGPVSYFYEASNSSAITGPNNAFVSPVYQSVALSTSQIPTPGTPEGTYYWHVRAVDAVGNSSAWSSAWKIIVDDTPPSVTAPGNITIGTGPGATSCSVTVSDAMLGSATASDANGVTVVRAGVPAGNVFPKGTTTITYTATDGAGNTATATQTVTVSDNTPPVLTLLGANPYLQPYGTPFVDPGYTATDNCGGTVTVVRTGTVNTSAPVGTSVVLTYTATDSDGNHAAKTRTVTIVANPPANKDACKNGGWQFLTRSNGTLFKNQGDCVSYTENGK